MALDYTLATKNDEVGAVASRPTFTTTISFPGDAAYATAGSALFSKFVSGALNRLCDVVAVHGYGYTAGAITHLVQYVESTDKLKVFVLAGTEVPDTTDLSTATFDVTVTAK